MPSYSSDPLDSSKKKYYHYAVAQTLRRWLTGSQVLDHFWSADNSLVDCYCVLLVLFINLVRVLSQVCRHWLTCQHHLKPHVHFFCWYASGEQGV